MENDIKHLITLRQSLHQNPELSGSEEYTAEALKRFIIKYQPDEIIDNIGGYGVAFVFKSKTDGPTVMFRGEMDALPILETNNFDYASRNDGVSHQCGHDGHMAILVGLAQKISKNPPKKGRVVLLFQPAEETGEGSTAIITDPNFSRILPDMVFSLHNVPGYPKGSIVLKHQTFTAASQGLVVKLRGKTSHAAEPEKGISPAIAMSKIIENITALPEKKHLFSDFVLATVVHARLGERTFGTAPGHAEILITFRAHNNEDMEVLNEHAQSMIHIVSNHEKLKADISFTDIYPVTFNHPTLTRMVFDKAKKLGMQTIKLEKPFPWAEDFAQFSHRFKSVIFGLGAGEDSPKLHNADYDFPDDIIPEGIKLYYGIYDEMNLQG